MSIKTSRSLISTQQAAQILGVSQGRVRQLVLPGPHGEEPVLWSDHLGQKILVVDEAEVKRYGKKMERLRAQGKVRGAVPQGYAPDRPGVYRKKRA